MPVLPADARRVGPAAALREDVQQAGVDLGLMVLVQDGCWHRVDEVLQAFVYRVRSLEDRRNVCFEQVPRREDQCLLDAAGPASAQRLVHPPGEIEPMRVAAAWHEIGREPACERQPRELIDRRHVALCIGAAHGGIDLGLLAGDDDLQRHQRAPELVCVLEQHVAGLAAVDDLGRAQLEPAIGQQLGCLRDDRHAVVARDQLVLLAVAQELMQAVGARVVVLGNAVEVARILVEQARVEVPAAVVEEGADEGRRADEADEAAPRQEQQVDLFEHAVGGLQVGLRRRDDLLGPPDRELDPAAGQRLAAVALAEAAKVLVALPELRRPVAAEAVDELDHGLERPLQLVEPPPQRAVDRELAGEVEIGPGLELGIVLEDQLNGEHEVGDVLLGECPPPMRLQKDQADFAVLVAGDRERLLWRIDDRPVGLDGEEVDAAIVRPVRQQSNEVEPRDLELEGGNPQSEVEKVASRIRVGLRLPGQDIGADVALGEVLEQLTQSFIDPGNHGTLPVGCVRFSSGAFCQERQAQLGRFSLTRISTGWDPGVQFLARPRTAVKAVSLCGFCPI